MSALFSRPSLITSNDPIPLPSPRLDQSSTHPDIPSPFVAKMLEFELASQLSILLSSEHPDQSVVLQYVETWIAALPLAYSVTNPDLSFDIQHPRLVFQRLQLHCSGYMTLLLLLQPSLIPPPPHQPSPNINQQTHNQAQNQAYAINTALNLMQSSLQFFTLSYPDKIKYFMVAFSPFNTGALLCSVLASDKNRSLPRRREVVEAVGTALFIASRLNGRTKMGTATFCVLSKLVSRLDLEEGERGVLEGVGRDGPGLDTSTGVESLLDVNGNTVFAAEELDVGGESWDGRFADGDGIPFTVGGEMELGVLDGVWDWESVLFDPFR